MKTDNVLTILYIVLLHRATSGRKKWRADSASRQNYSGNNKNNQIKFIQNYDCDTYAL